MDAFIHRYQVNSNGMIRNSCTIWMADKIITAIDEMGGWVIKRFPIYLGKFRLCMPMYSNLNGMK